MTIPQLTQDQRNEALKKAQEMRSLRTQLRNQLKAGKISVEEVLNDMESEVSGKMRVKYMLESLPQVGKITAAKIMEEVGIDEVRRIQGLGARQRADLLARLTK